MAAMITSSRMPEPRERPEEDPVAGASGGPGPARLRCTGGAGGVAVGVVECPWASPVCVGERWAPLAAVHRMGGGGPARSGAPGRPPGAGRALGSVREGGDGGADLGGDLGRAAAA